MDYYGKQMSEEYLALVNGGPGWRQSLEKYRVNTVMMTTASPLAQSPAADPRGGWSIKSEDVAIYKRLPN